MGKRLIECKIGREEFQYLVAEVRDDDTVILAPAKGSRITMSLRAIHEIAAMAKGNHKLAEAKA